MPVELDEAAMIDGCNRWQAFWRIELPLARSGIASAGIFAFLTSTLFGAQARPRMFLGVDACALSRGAMLIQLGAKALKLKTVV